MNKIILTILISCYILIVGCDEKYEIIKDSRQNPEWKILIDIHPTPSFVSDDPSSYIGLQVIPYNFKTWQCKQMIVFFENQQGSICWAYDNENHETIDLFENGKKVSLPISIR